MVKCSEIEALAQCKPRVLNINVYNFFRLVYCTREEREKENHATFILARIILADMTLFLRNMVKINPSAFN